ncbi:hypothetical protein Tco_1486166 [Tanacetum coccineum]
MHDNIVPKPDLALELGKSISLTEAEEEAVAREVHATHARIASGPNPEHIDDEFLVTAYPKVHENLKLITDERVIEENPESHSGSIHQTVTSTPPVIAPFTDVSSTKPSSLVTPPPINTEATTITTSLPEITPFIALQLRVARLEQEMSEVKKTDHSADVLALIKSQVPTAVDKYLGTKLDDALLKVLKRVRVYPESRIKNQESEKSPKSPKKFDLKSALFKHINKNKSANRNPTNYHLYHALMEALIADEDAMDKEVKDHKRKHDSDDDDEGPLAGSNQALTLTGWQITDIRDVVVDSSMHRSDPESEHSEQSSYDIPMQDEGHVSDLEDTDNAHIPKVSTTM